MSTPATFDLTHEQKEVLVKCLSVIEAATECLKEEIPQLRGYNTEKVITFLQEVRVLHAVDKALGENLQPCSSAYESALDAVGEKITTQNKDMAGVSPNTSKFNMKPGWTLGGYTREMVRRSGKKKPYLVVHNRSRSEICIAPVKNFTHSDKTYLSWGQVTSVSGAKVIPAS